MSGGVVSGAAVTTKDCLFDAESPFASLTDSRTYLMPVRFEGEVDRAAFPGLPDGGAGFILEGPGAAQRSVAG